MLQYCKKCLFPATKPDLYFNAQGICDACISADNKHGRGDAIDWTARAKEFESIVVPRKLDNDGWYDCIVPVSGGKDSTWLVHAMKSLHWMNPLAVTFDQFDQTSIGRKNLDALRSVGVDHVHFTLNPHVVRQLVKKGFEIVGDPYWVNHVGMFTVPFHISTRFNVQLVIFGEQPQLEYGGPEESKNNMIMDKRWRQEFGGMRGFREEDMVDPEISAGDLRILKYPTDDQIQDVGVIGLFYGYFFKWDAVSHVKIIEQYGWSGLTQAPSGSWLNYENCDMHFISLREHLKYVKYGYGRATDQLNIAIRDRRITRLEALNFAREIDGECPREVILEFCDYIKITEEEFYNVRDSFVNQEIFVRDSYGNWVMKNPRY